MLNILIREERFKAVRLLVHLPLLSQILCPLGRVVVADHPPLPSLRSLRLALRQLLDSLGLRALVSQLWMGRG